MNGRIRGKVATAIATCLAFAAIDQVDATTRTNETAMLAVAIPQSCDKDVGSGGPSLAFRFGAPAIPAVQSLNVTTPAPSPSMETTGSVPPMHNEMPTPQRQEIVASGATIIGIASTYDPGDPTDLDAGNEETASGERYDADDWTAAIQIDLRDRFGGVRYGRNYQPAYALVEAGDKRLVVRINDVGPLKPGRVIDLNVRAMRYFDPSMQIGLIADVKVSPLLGEDYALGPVTGPMPVTVASRELDVVAGP